MTISTSRTNSRTRRRNMMTNQCRRIRLTSPSRFAARECQIQSQIDFLHKCDPTVTNASPACRSSTLYKQHVVHGVPALWLHRLRFVPSQDAPGTHAHHPDTRDDVPTTTARGRYQVVLVGNAAG